MTISCNFLLHRRELGEENAGHDRTKVPVTHCEMLRLVFALLFQNDLEKLIVSPEILSPGRERPKRYPILSFLTL